MTIDFQHRQSAHCESGVTANLLSHHGVGIDEPLAFGIGSGLFFSYMPFIRLYDAPLTSFRYLPGSIFKQTAHLLGVRMRVEKFRDREKAMDALDRALDLGQPVGVQVGVYWLPFFPEAYRFHFNAHNMVVYGRENGEYLI
ncbi:BtrH N-terminal domain-containing protein, partial [bacterium]|nr:BtrH N-terminal domain-containing protein [bacterium]